VVVWGAHLKFININGNVEYDSSKNQHFIAREHRTNVYVSVTCSWFGLPKFCIAEISSLPVSTVLSLNCTVL